MKKQYSIDKLIPQLKFVTAEAVGKFLAKNGFKVTTKELKRIASKLRVNFKTIKLFYKNYKLKNFG